LNTSLVWKWSDKPYFRKFFSSHLKSLAWGTQRFCWLPLIGKCNFEAAQHIDKQITDVSSTISAIQNGTKFEGITPGGFDATREKMEASTRQYAAGSSYAMLLDKIATRLVTFYFSNAYTCDWVFDACSSELPLTVCFSPCGLSCVLLCVDSC